MNPMDRALELMSLLATPTGKLLGDALAQRIIANSIESAVRAERERAAKIAKDFVYPIGHDCGVQYTKISDAIAAAIRSEPCSSEPS